MGIQKIALFGKRPSPYYGKDSSNKQRETTVHYFRHQGQSIRNISRTLKFSSSAVAKTINCYDETGSHEDQHRKEKPRITSAAGDKFIRVNSLRKCSNSSNRHISTSINQIQSNIFIKPYLHQLMSQSAVQKPSLKLQTASNADVEARWLGKTS